METKKVSIGIPFYNNAGTLAASIRSVLMQSFTNWELILLDDGSTDDSLEIARSFKDKRIRVISDGENKQLSYRLNQLIELSQGELIARMDADDMMHPMRIELQHNFFTNYPLVDVIGTGIYLIDNTDNVYGVLDYPAGLPQQKQLIETSLFYHPTVMAKAAWYKKYRYDATYVRAEDMELWCRAVAEGKTKFGIIPEPLLFYRKDGHGSLAKTLKSISTQQKIVNKYGRDLSGRVPSLVTKLKLMTKSCLHRGAYLLSLRSSLLDYYDRRLKIQQTSDLQEIVNSIKSFQPAPQGDQPDHKKVA